VPWALELPNFLERHPECAATAELDEDISDSLPGLEEGWDREEAWSDTGGDGSLTELQFSPFIEDLTSALSSPDTWMLVFPSIK